MEEPKKNPEERINSIFNGIKTKIEELHGRGILLHHEKPLLEQLAEHHYDRAYEALMKGENVEEEIAKLEAISNLLKMADEKTLDDKDRYSMMLALIRTIDSRFRPAGRSFLDINTRSGEMSTIFEIYRPGTDPAHDMAVHIAGEGIVRHVKIPLRELSDEEKHVEALRILAEIASRRPVLLRRDKVEEVVNVPTLMPTRYGFVPVIRREILEREEPVSPYPTDIPLHLLGSALGMAFSPHPLDKQFFALATLRGSQPVWNAFNTWMYLKSKGVEHDRTMESDYIKFLAQIFAPTIKEMTRKVPGADIDVVHGMFMDSVRELLKIWAKNMIKHRRRLRKLYTSISEFTYKLDKALRDEYDRLSTTPQQGTS